MPTTAREIKDIVMSVKVPRSLVFLIDEEADEDGLTRGAIIRRHLIQAYRKRADRRLRSLSKDAPNHRKGASA